VQCRGKSDFDRNCHRKKINPARASEMADRIELMRRHLEQMENALGAAAVQAEPAVTMTRTGHSAVCPKRVHPTRAGHLGNAR
jgi:hypothetical protein